MSTQNIHTFEDKVTQSPELQARLAEIQQQAARTTAEAIARLAQEIGTPFTAEELLSHSGPSHDELADHELAGVAGGGTITAKEVTSGDIGSLWGLLGTNYRYTMDGKSTFTSTSDYEVGQSTSGPRLYKRR
jgi:predicted ribosomally synthesized peptide with nif11-like leader